jgi:hypothetical protein
MNFREAKDILNTNGFTCIKQVASNKYDIAFKRGKWKKSLYFTGVIELASDVERILTDALLQCDNDTNNQQEIVK